MSTDIKEIAEGWAFKEFCLKITPNIKLTNVFRADNIFNKYGFHHHLRLDHSYLFIFSKLWHKAKYK